MPPAGNARPLPKFGEWDAKNPGSGEGFTVLFNKARDQKKTSGLAVKPNGIPVGDKHNHNYERNKDPNKDKKPNQQKKFLCCFYAS